MLLRFGQILNKAIELDNRELISLLVDIETRGKRFQTKNVCLTSEEVNLILEYFGKEIEQKAIQFKNPLYAKRVGKANIVHGYIACGVDAEI